jgi:hypothetical protein
MSDTTYRRHIRKIAVVILFIINEWFIGLNDPAQNLRFRARTGLPIPGVGITGVEVAQIEPPLLSGHIETNTLGFHEVADFKYRPFDPFL